MEQPDFILKNLKDEKIWLEITEVNPNFSIRKNEGTKNDLLKKLEKRLKEQNIWNFFANCSLKKISFKKSEKKSLVNKLEIEMMKFYNEFIESKKSYLFIKNIKSDYFRSICIQKHSRITISEWWRTFFTNNLNKSILIKSISKKDEKLKNYKKDVSKNFLFLFINEWKASSYNLEDINYFKNLKIESNFDKLFLYSRFWNKFIVLKS
jgi:hypothetical protein